MCKRVLLAVTVSFLIAGCASVKEGVVGTVRADVRPFSAETINALSVRRLEIRRNSLTRLREYYDDDTPEMADLLDAIGRVDRFRRSLALYSLELVSITGLDVPEEQKSRLLADYLREAIRPLIVDNLGMPADEFETAVDNIEVQPNFLDAIKGVQPLVTHAYDYHEALLLRISDDLLPRAIDALDVAIEEDYATLLQQDEELEERRDELLLAMQYLNRATRGDTQAITELNASPAFRHPSVRPPADPTWQDLRDAEHQLVAQLESNEKIRQLIRPSVESYMEARNELDLLDNTVSDGVKLARLLLAAWRRAHEDLGNGVKDPGRWLSAAYQVARVT